GDGVGPDRRGGGGGDGEGRAAPRLDRLRIEARGGSRRESAGGERDALRLAAGDRGGDGGGAAPALRYRDARRVRADREVVGLRPPALRELERRDARVPVEGSVRRDV